MKYRPPTPEENRKLRFWQMSTFISFLFGYICFYLIRKNEENAKPFLVEEFADIGWTEVGLIAAAGEYAYSFGKIIMGPLADKIGGKRIFYLGMFGGVAMNLVFSFGNSFWHFALTWAIARFFLAAGWGGLSKVIGAWYSDKDAGKAMGVVSTSFMFGDVVSTLLSAAIAYGIESSPDVLTWRALFFIPAGIVFIYGSITWFLTKQDPHQVIPDVAFGNHGEETFLHKSTQARGKTGKEEENPENVTHESFLVVFRKLLKLRFFRNILLFSVTTTVLRRSIMVWSASFLYFMGLGKAAAILSSAVYPLMGAIGTILLGWYTDKYAPDKDRARVTAWMLIGLVISLSLIPVFAPPAASQPARKVQKSVKVDDKKAGQEAKLTPAKSDPASKKDLATPAQTEEQPAEPELSLTEQFREKPSLLILVGLLGLAGFFLMGPYSLSSGAFTIDAVGPHYAGTATGMIDFAGYLASAFVMGQIAFIFTSSSWNTVFYLLAVFALLSWVVALRMSRLLKQGRY